MKPEPADARAKVPGGKKAKRIVQLLLEDHFQHRRHEIATDFRSNLISKTALEIDDVGYPISYRGEEEDDPAPNAKGYRAHLASTGLVNASELINYLTSLQVGSMLGAKEEIIQAMNIIAGHHPKSASTVATVAGNRHFDLNSGEQDRMKLGAGIEAMRGFLMSVRPATARILVNVQVKNMAFYDEGPLDALMRAYMQENRANNVSVAKFVKKLSVDVTHIARKNKSGRRIPRIKTIQGLATRDDGRGSDHPPRVSQFGAGAKEVEFFLDAGGESSSATPKATESGKKGKRGQKAGPKPASKGKYISVYDFFQQSES